MEHIDDNTLTGRPCRFGGRGALTLENTRLGRARPYRERLLYILLTLVVMFIPAIIAAALCAVRGYSIFDAVPLWHDDELWYFQQYEDIAAYGHPLGYFGYAGTHASVGTWGPWGMFPVLLTGLMARVFGWGLHAFVYYNFLYLAAAALIFILLTKPDIRGLIKLALANATAYVAICYTAVCMNECARYALALVLTGIMYRIYTVPRVSRARLVLRCTLVPLLLVYAMLFYRILCAFIPIYMILMLRCLRVVWRVAAGGAATVIAVKLSYLLNTPTCCPYITGDPTYSFPTKALKRAASFYSFLSDTGNIDPFRLLAQTNTDAYPFFTWFCVLAYTLMIVLAVRLLLTFRDPAKRKETAISLMSLWLLVSFWGGHILMYTTSSATFLRGCYTAVYCVVFLLCLMPKTESHAWAAAMIVCLLGVFTFMDTFVNSFAPASRFSTEAQQETWDAEAEELAKVMEVDEDASDPWENAVVLCHAEAEITYILPAGVGLNGPIDGIINENARYVIIGHYSYDDEAERETDIEALLDSGHAVILETDSYTVFENMGRSYD